MSFKNQFGQVIGTQVKYWIPRQMPKKMAMQGNFCTVEPLDIDLHGPKLFKAFQFENHGETWTYLPFGPFSAYDEFSKWLSRASVSKMFFSIVDIKDHAPQGLASYHDIDPEHGVCEVGSVHYSKLLQKKRSGTEAMYLMMYHIFEELGYRRYQWRCNTLNWPSRAAAERLGFKLEGIFRQSNVFKGFNRDTAWYSIIDSEWPGLKEKFQKWLDPSNFGIDGNQILKLQEI